MGRMNFGEISPEKRRENLEKAKQAKLAKIEAAYPELVAKFRVE